MQPASFVVTQPNIEKNRSMTRSEIFHNYIVLQKVLEFKAVV